MVLGKYNPPKNQLLKWIGNKQKHADTITKFFPPNFKAFHEPFLGSAAILATVAPKKGFGGDVYQPLIEIWQTLKSNPNELIDWYASRMNGLKKSNKEEHYKQILKTFNRNPNGADFLYLVRACYGGVIRFRKQDGYMSTPCGDHQSISVESFKKRVVEWHPRIKKTEFINADFSDLFTNAKKGDLIYCDPPYSHSQGILYGAQSFELQKLIEKIEWAKSKGIFVVLSIDGKKKSGNLLCDIEIPKNLFKKEVFLNNGSSMLRRFQLEGQSTQGEEVNDRLLLTYDFP